MKDTPYTKTFPCGLQFAFKRSASPVAYSALTIKSGTRDEPALSYGIAHLTEHMLFKGTEKRRAKEISDRLERLGGDLNAYTTKEETVIYSTVLKEDTGKAVDLMMELAFTSTFPEKELEKERHVVIDEINMYKDSPSECIFDDFEEKLFGGHVLARSILGDARQLKKISSDDIREYVRSNFIPENMCISIVADISEAKAEKIACDAIGKYVSKDHVPSPSAGQSISDPLGTTLVFSKEVTKKNHQVNCIIGTGAYSFYDRERYATILLNNILGGPSSNSRLNQVLREKNALVYSVDSSYAQYRDSGSMMIYFGCDKGNTERCISLVRAEIRRLQDSVISESSLKAAKKQLLGQLAIASDNGENQALSMGKSMTVFGSIMPDEQVRERINSISAKQLQETAGIVLNESRLSTLIYK